MSGLSQPAAAARTPAPGGLGIVQQFLNSADIEAGTDSFATTSGLTGWLRTRGLALGDAELDEAGRRRLVGFREALRDLVGARDGREPSRSAADDARAAVEQAARGALLVVGLDADGGARLEPASSGVDAIIGRILAAVVASTADGTWARLKICRNDACRWSFYDASRNRSGHWCSMAICGNRMKGRAFRLRHSWPEDEVPLL